MRYLRWAVYAFLVASIAWSARELVSAARTARDMTADGKAMASTAAGAVLPKESLDAPAPAPRPSHAELGDTNSAGGKVFKGKGGPDRAVLPGGGVIIDSDGSRLEIAPPSRPKPSPAAKAAESAAAAASQLSLPALDDAAAALGERKRRAEVLLGLCALAAFGLILWARRWRPE